LGSRNPYRGSEINKGVQRYWLAAAFDVRDGSPTQTDAIA
jgi:hypothetical protein